MRHATTVVLSLFLCSVACGSDEERAVSSQASAHVLDFDSPIDMRVITVNNAEISQRDSKLFVKFMTAENASAGVTIRPETPWDWSDYDQFGLAMDIGNRGDESVQLNLGIRDARGAGFTRSAVISSGVDKTYYVELRGADITMDSGLRDNPVSWDFDGVKFTWMWGTEQLDTSAVTEIALSVQSLNSDRELTIGNLRLIINPTRNPDYLTAIVDRYGQNAKTDFPGKLHSDIELKRRHEAERTAFRGKLLADRSRFGGWKNGPKLQATGYFRVEKIDGKWSLVDPDGHLFFSTGLANIRMSNTSTITGRDYPQESLTQRTPDDLTPEDSLGMNPAPVDALPKRFLSSKLRYAMFEWLPEESDPLSDHYGYRRSVHTGPMSHGETISFYRANLERKYRETSPASFMRDWRETTLARMNDWGFTSFGNWVDPIYYDNERVPYFANGWIIGDFKTVSSGDDFWAPLPDPFDPKFAERAIKTVETIAGDVKGSQWCIGVFIDNEKSWGRMGTPQGQYGIVINTLARSGEDSPTKTVFTKLMKEKYGSVDKLNTRWNENIASWREFDEGIVITNHSQEKQADYAIMLEAYASEYFRVVHDTLAAAMPNHLYMGARFASWGMTPEVRRAAAKYADVMTYNRYREAPNFDRWDFLEDIDLPSLIGEFHMGAVSDTGFFHAGLVKAANQADRARMYKNYMYEVIDNPYFVGAHWFQYIDSPITGRAYDGENYNVGFVSVTDTPYEELVNAAKDVNTSLYPRRFTQ